MISPLLDPSRKPPNALRGLRRKMAHFIPSAGAHTKGSYNLTKKKRRRWAPGRLVAEPRGSRFSGARAIASPCGDDWRHGVAAESLEVLRRQTSDVDVGSNDSSYPYWLGTWLRGLYVWCTGRPTSDNCRPKFSSRAATRKDSVTLGRSSVHYPSKPLAISR